MQRIFTHCEVGDMVCVLWEHLSSKQFFSTFFRGLRGCHAHAATLRGPPLQIQSRHDTLGALSFLRTNVQSVQREMHQRWNRSHYGRKRRNGSGLGGLDEETMVLVSIIGIRVRTNNHREFECDAVRVGCERSRGGERQRVVVQISDFTPPP